MENKNFNNEKINNNGYGYVDLDLPSGTLWATCNVGATKSVDYGLYFQWGDTVGYTADQVGTGDGKKKFASDWSDYKWNPSGDGETFTKYANPGDTLDFEDDAAHVNMGGSWHMPTPDQINELFANTTSEWVKRDGVNGRLFTSKKDGSKSIFIPAAGGAWDGSVQVSGDYGIVWSSMLCTDFVDSGQSLDFGSGDVSLLGSYRCDGLSVRGVIDRINDNSKGKKDKKNDELNLVEILKNVPKGTKLWSPICGELEFLYVRDGIKFPGIVCNNNSREWGFLSNGKFDPKGECMIFPSKENMNWETFNIPTHKHFEPFQKVLCMVVNKPGCKIWSANFYSHYDEDKKQHYLVGGFLRNDDEVIPYKGNEDKLGKPANK